MGCFDSYCCFCAGPFQDARAGWLNCVKTGQDDSEVDCPSEDSVTISSEDGKYWADWVFVGPVWSSWVSPPCDDDGYGGSIIDDSTDWQLQPYLMIHRGCLSFLCRRFDITPRELWESLYAPDADYNKYQSELTGLLYCLEYYDMAERNTQFFGYAIERRTPQKDNPEMLDIWYDYSTMEDLRWLLARPTVFPVAAPLSISLSPSSLETKSPLMGVFAIAELLDLILDHIINHLPQPNLESELDSPSTNSTHVPHSVTSATQTVFSLLQVNRAFYSAIVEDRQHLFIRLAWEHGWMLPATPMDWAQWPNGTFHNGEVFQNLPPPAEALDWRGYLLTFLRKEDVHVRNRWRMHRMGMQFAGGKKQVSEEGEVTWNWKVGKKGVRTELTAPKAWEWELTPEA